MTTIRVAADRAHPYFGFTCSDPAPEQIGIHTMQRDRDMSGDDSVAVVLDTFGDQRSGYYFRVTTVLLALITRAALAQQSSVRIRETGAGDIRIDGRLDDPSWASAPSLPLTPSNMRRYCQCISHCG